MAEKKVKVSKKPAAKKTTPKKSTVKKAAAKKTALQPVAKETVGALSFNPYDVKKNEQYMNEGQLEHFHIILNQWKSQLMEEVDSTVGHMQEDAGIYPDTLDRASQEEGFSLELRKRDRERKLIKKIEEALIMIDNKEYGYCEDCGTEIGIQRLEARPTADKCIDCKTFEEIREKQGNV